MIKRLTGITALLALSLMVLLPATVSAAPPAQSQEHQGTIEIIHDHSINQYVYTLILPNGTRIDIPNGENMLKGYRSGQTVRLRGAIVAGVLSLDGECCVAPTYQPNTPVAPGTRTVLWIMIRLSDLPLASVPYSSSYVTQVMQTNTPSVRQFVEDNSYGTVSLTTTVVPNWTVSSLSGSNCNSGTLKTEARAYAVAQGYTPDNYDHVVIGYATGTTYYNNQCFNAQGLGEVGGRHTWINGGPSIKKVAHEFGHNFGLKHAHKMDCGTTVIQNWPSNTGCYYDSTHTDGSPNEYEYGNVFDVMGSGDSLVHHYGAASKDRLGWLNYTGVPVVVTHLTETGLYPVGDITSDAVGSFKAIRILKAVDASGLPTWYWVEFRPSHGGSYAPTGVVITLAGPFDNQNYLLDMTPNTSTFTDAPLQEGLSYTDSAIGLTITPVYAPLDDDATVAGVQIDIVPNTTCGRAAPTVSVIGSASRTGAAGSPQTYPIKVHNNDNAACPATNFYLAAGIPSGWGYNALPLDVPLAPGQEKTISVIVVSAANATPGTYNFGVAAYDFTLDTHQSNVGITYIVQ